MQYREIGNTGMEASVIGLGAEHLDFKPYEVVEETIREALSQGVNIMDAFMPGAEVRKNIGRAIAGNRGKLLIQGHICSTDVNEQYDISRDLDTAKRYFESLLTDLGTDYIDFGMLFFVDSEQDYKAVFETDILQYAQDLKRQGVIRAIGASAHNPVTARRMVESGQIELLMFSVNPAFDMMSGVNDIDTLVDDRSIAGAQGMDPARAELYRACERAGVAVTTMKTLGAGKLLSARHTPFAGPLSVGQCIHYALTRPAVVSALIGCKSADEVKEAVRYLDMTEEERDYSAAIGSKKANFRGACVYCSHCLPCPANIDIAAVNKYLDIARLDEANIPPSIRQHYGAMAANGGDCVGCGSCEERCPFGVPVIENMAEAEALLG